MCLSSQHLFLVASRQLRQKMLVEHACRLRHLSTHAVSVCRLFATTCGAPCNAHVTQAVARQLVSALSGVGAGKPELVCRQRLQRGALTSSSSTSRATSAASSTTLPPWPPFAAPPALLPSCTTGCSWMASRASVPRGTRLWPAAAPRAAHSRSCTRAANTWWRARGTLSGSLVLAPIACTDLIADSARGSCLST